jgi:hypothetical protein
MVSQAVVIALTPTRLTYVLHQALTRSYEQLAFGLVQSANSVEFADVTLPEDVYYSDLLFSTLLAN